MAFLPLGSDRSYFVDAIGAILALGWPLRVKLCSARPCGHAPAAALPHGHGEPRLNILVAGSRRYHLSAGGRLQPRLLTPGEAVFWAPHGWSYLELDRSAVLIGLVFHRTFLRAVAVRSPGGNRSALSTSCHTEHAPGEACQHLVRALSVLAEGVDDEEAAAPVVRALLMLSRRHLLAASVDVSGSMASRKTFHGVLAHLHQHFAEPLTRLGVARALDLHPNYLSTLCSRQGGRSFHATIEDIRLTHARHLLRHGQATVRQVAELCGYESDGSFIRAFKRRHRLTPDRFRSGGDGLEPGGAS